jgi:hypothetical protein
MGHRSVVWRLKIAAVAAGCSVGACAIMPDLPPDWALPMQEILLHSACELQWALSDLSTRNDPQFDPTAWKIAITLNPLMDADIQPGLGLTRRVPTKSGASRFANWVLGSGNGVTADLHGTRTGSIDFDFDSAKLMKDKHLPCDRESISYHALTKGLGIANWLQRSVDAAYISGSTLDTPKFSAEVNMKFNGAGSYTYTFPPGTDLATLSGFYQVDEKLNINFTKKPSKSQLKIVTLPLTQDQYNQNQAPVPATISILEDQQVSLQQIRQQLQNLRVVPQ